ncbi:putative DOMON domain-containing protein [Helianthus anomalus]
MITRCSPSMLPTNLKFPVLSLSAEFLNNEITIYDIGSPFASGFIVNQVWQAGKLVLDCVPPVHKTSINRELDFLYVNI